MSNLMMAYTALQQSFQNLTLCPLTGCHVLILPEVKDFAGRSSMQTSYHAQQTNFLYRTPAMSGKQANYCTHLVLVSSVLNAQGCTLEFFFSLLTSTLPVLK